FTVSLPTDVTSTTATEVTITVTGTADNGVDYTTIPVTVTIPADSNSALIPVEVLDDLELEGDETVIVTLVSTNNPSIGIHATENEATVTIGDNEDNGDLVVSIEATTPNANEPDVDGAFTVSLPTDVTSTTATEVTITVTGTADNGVDYTTIPVTVTIPADSNS
ncbi:Calx-beta domain-containing protein, partial [Gilvimarinus sp. SDUM040013]|uniref:Calx-beta domain-containing protein n=1 Tax=Gilvimarinus gilvus TaxID=3058038 RepID=UPI002671B186